MTEREGREGQQLGNYRLLTMLGRGGFAEVYLGEHIYLGTQAAIKVLLAQLADDDKEHFRKEARIIARLVHPNIVRVLEFGINDDTPFLVVDYAPNGTLRKRYPRGAQLPLATVVNYVIQLAEALQYAHDQKVIHRDVKPENMLLGRRNEVLLSDFGIALIVQGSQYQSTQGMQDIAGTVAYMAPEQIQYQASPASDQYSLAIVVYEWLTGSRPFYGSFTEIAVKHAMAAPTLLREVVPTIPAEVEAVVMKALAKDPKLRYPRVLDFATALAQAAGIQPVITTMLSNTGGLEDVPSSFLNVSVPAKEGLATPVLTRDNETSEPLPHTPTTPTLSTPVNGPDTPSPVHRGEEAGSEDTIAVPSTETPPLRRASSISRRGVVLTLAGVGTVALLAGAGIPYYLSTHRGQKPVITPTSTIGSSTMVYTYRSHTDKVWSVAWSPKSDRVVSGSSDKTAQVWDATTGGNSYLYSGHSDSVYAVAWSPDGNHIATASNDTTVQVWDATGGHPFTYTGHSSWVWALAWSPDSTRIASASGDATVQVWDATTRQRLYTYSGHSTPIYTVKWSPDGTRIASAGVDGSVQIWDAFSGMVSHIYQSDASAIWAVAWSPDSKRIVAAGNDNLVRVWNAANGDLPFSYHGHSDFVYCVTWSPDGKYIASGSDDRTVQVWNSSGSDSFFTYTGHSDAVRSVAWSPNNKYLASGSWDKTVQVWHISLK